MKKTELKRMIKSIVQECLQESLMQDGFLSGIIKEVVSGLGHSVITETNNSNVNRAKFNKKAKQNLDRVQMEETKNSAKVWENVNKSRSNQENPQVMEMKKMASLGLGGLDVFSDLKTEDPVNEIEEEGRDTLIEAMTDIWAQNLNQTGYDLTVRKEAGAMRGGGARSVAPLIQSNQHLKIVADAVSLKSTEEN